MGMRIVALLLFTSSCYAQETHEHPTIRRMHHVNNSIRHRFGLDAQHLSPILTKAAQYQAEFMAKTHDFRHDANSSPGKRANKFGYDGVVVENLARNYFSVEDAFFAWTKSPEHWRAIISKNTDVGYGYSIANDGTTYWVTVYGTPRDNKWLVQKTNQEPTHSETSRKLFVKPHQKFMLVGK